MHTHAATLQRWLQNTQPPRTKAVRRKSHLTDDTWSMVRWKRHHFLRARTVQHLQNRYCLLAVFHAWKATAPVSDCSSWMRLCDRTIALHLWQYQRLSRCVTKAVRLDDKNFYVHLAAKKGEIAADEGMNRLWASIKPLLPKNIKRRSQQKIRCRGPTNADLMNHYCSLEAGEPCDYASLLSRCFEDQKILPLCLPDLMSK